MFDPRLVDPTKGTGYNTSKHIKTTSMIFVASFQAPFQPCQYVWSFRFIKTSSTPIHLKRVQNLRFIYRIQWKIRESRWFIYLQRMVLHNYQPFTNPAGLLPEITKRLVRSSPGFQAPSAAARSFCQYQVCPKPQSVVIARLLFLLHAMGIVSHYIAFHQICLVYSFQFGCCRLALTVIHSAYPFEMFEHLATIARRCIAPASRASGSLHHVRKLMIDVDHDVKWSILFFFANSLGIRTLLGIGAKSWSSCRHALGTAEKKKHRGCFAEKAPQETWISVAS